MLTCPESPRWLSQVGKKSEADSAAKKLWGPSGASQLDSECLAAGPMTHTQSDMTFAADLPSAALLLPEAHYAMPVTTLSC